MSKTLPQEKEKVVIVVQGGQVVGVYSSIPDKSVEVEIFDYDSRGMRERVNDIVNDYVESGVAPYVLY